MSSETEMDSGLEHGMCHEAQRRKTPCAPRHAGGNHSLRLGAHWQHSCSLTTMPALLDELKSELRALVGAENLIDGGQSLETLSKDFYWYSPVLRRLIEDKREIG